MNFISELKIALNKPSLLAIAIMCFFWSVSSLMVFSILPVFMTEELYITPLELGWIEGIAVSLAFVAKILSGILSDYIKQRRILLIIGTATSLIFKSLFALATNGFSIFIARSMDRLAKGVRSAPVDALIADLYPKENHGMSYGLRQFFYIMGSVVGSLVAAILLGIYHDYRLVFWFSLIPVFFALMTIIFFVHDAPTHIYGKANKFEWYWKDLKYLPKSFWHIIMVSSVLMLTRFSDSFLSLKAREIGMSIAILPLLLMGYELMHAFISLPVGWLADSMYRKKNIDGWHYHFNACQYRDDLCIITWPGFIRLFNGWNVYGGHTKFDIYPYCRKYKTPFAWQCFCYLLFYNRHFYFNCQSTCWVFILSL